MTKHEVNSIIELVKENDLYCNVELETDERYLLGDIVIYSLLVVHVYADEKKNTALITLQIDLDPKSETYYLDDISGSYDEDIRDRIFPISQYCKHLINRYM